jgi:hypothetical protein
MSILVLSSHLCSSNDLFSSAFPTQILYAFLISSDVLRIPKIILLHLITLVILDHLCKSQDDVMIFTSTNSLDNSLFIKKWVSRMRHWRNHWSREWQWRMEFKRNFKRNLAPFLSCAIVDAGLTLRDPKVRLLIAKLWFVKRKLI